VTQAAFESLPIILRCQGQGRFKILYWGSVELLIFLHIFSYSWCHCVEQESRAVARKPRDAVLFRFSWWAPNYTCTLK